MSTLDLPRIHFRGRFFADPSTQNNRREWHEPGADLSDDPYKQNWNKSGQHEFELRGCRVGAASDTSGKLLRAEADDPLVGGDVTTPRDGDGVLGKMVDLDPDYQHAPQLWGVRIRIQDKAEKGVSGVLETATLYPRHKQRSDAANDLGAGGSYAATLTDLEWDAGISGVLAELKDRSADRLAIAFTLYHYGRTARPGTLFGKFEGSVVGTVGPASEERTPPRVLVKHRYDPLPWGVHPGSAFVYPNRFPHGPVPAKVDDTRDVLVLDFGNGLLELEADGVLKRREYGTLTVRAERLQETGVPEEVVDLSGAIPIDMEAYESVAGVHELGLPPEVASDPDVWRFFVESSIVGRILAERADGLRVEVSDPVVRLDPPRSDPEEDTVELRLRAFGQEAAGIQLVVYWLKGDPDPSERPAGLDWRVSGAETDGEGVLRITFSSSDPGTPRGAVDGTLVQVAVGLSVQPSERLATLGVRVFSSYPQDGTWANVEPILSQYAQVYPRMAFLSDPAAVRGFLSAYPELLLGKEMTEAKYMPVTRDLSRDKRDALLAWIAAGAPG